MLKYAKIVNEETKQCDVGLGNPDDQFNEEMTVGQYYETLGMTQMNVEEGYDRNWYLDGYAPIPPAPTHDEIKNLRKQYRQQHIDDTTAERSRRTANGTWTEEDEQAYLALDAEVTAYIEEHFPYPDEEEQDDA